MYLSITHIFLSLCKQAKRTRTSAEKRGKEHFLPFIAKISAYFRENPRPNRLVGNKQILVSRTTCPTYKKFNDPATPWPRAPGQAGKAKNKIKNKVKNSELAALRLAKHSQNLWRKSAPYGDERAQRKPIKVFLRTGVNLSRTDTRR